MVDPNSTGMFAIRQTEAEKSAPADAFGSPGGNPVSGDFSRTREGLLRIIRPS